MHLQTFSASEPELMNEAVALHIIKRIKTFSPTQNKKFVLVLPGERCLLGVYQVLKRECRAQRISFEHVAVLCLSEYLGVSPLDQNSQHRFTDQHFFSQVDIPPAQTHCLPGIPIHGSSADWASYESMITSLGGIHLSLVNLGQNGRVGLNGPGSSLRSRTRVVSLTSNKKQVENPPSPSSSSSSSESNEEQSSLIPTHGLTMGMGTIFDSAEILILASGEDCTVALKSALEGGVNHLCPASALQLHEDVTVFADSAAVSSLEPLTVTCLSSQLPIIVDTDTDIVADADPTQTKQEQERTPPSISVGTAAKHGLRVSPIVEFPTALQLALKTLSEVPNSSTKSRNAHMASVLAQELVNGHTTSPPAPTPALDLDGESNDMEMEIEEKRNIRKSIGVGRERGAGKGVGKTGLRIRTDFPFPPIPPPKPQAQTLGQARNQREGESRCILASVSHLHETRTNVKVEHVQGEGQGDSFSNHDGDDEGDSEAEPHFALTGTGGESISPSDLEQNLIDGHSPPLAKSANGGSTYTYTPAPSLAQGQSEAQPRETSPAPVVTTIPLPLNSKSDQSHQIPSVNRQKSNWDLKCNRTLLSKGEIVLATDSDPDEEDDQGPGM